MDQRCTASAGALTSNSVGVPDRIRGRCAGHEGARHTVPDTAGPPGAPGGRRERCPRRERAAGGVVVVAARDRGPRVHVGHRGCRNRRRVARLGMLTAPTGSARGPDRRRDAARTCRRRRPTAHRNSAARWRSRPTRRACAACSAVTISRCSRRWPQRATAATPNSFDDRVERGDHRARPRRRRSRGIPPVTPASVQARRWAVIASASR